MSIQLQLKNTLEKYDSTQLGEYYQGKVRDNYYQNDEIVMITTDRVSAFDHVLGTIPFKGQILTQIAKFWFEKTADIVPNHIISYPDPQVLLAKKAETLPVEVIVRGYITGSLWREYSQGINGQYGFVLPDELKKDEKFIQPILTPSTKAEYGLHDEPISKQEIIQNGLVEESIYSQAEEYALKLFSRGQEWADSRGLILVDTKYEFGIIDEELSVVDEIHTPDSSRYWVADEYENRFNTGEKQLMLDKENIRQWLINRGFSGDGTPPKLTDEIRSRLAERYIELYNRLIDHEFEAESGDVKTRITHNLRSKGLLV